MPHEPAATPAREQARQVHLPGTLCQRDDGWWWQVKLPGQAEAQDRPLKPKGSETPTDDLDTAQSLALQMYEQALAETIERRVKTEASETTAKLKAQFLEKVRDFSQVVETTKARLQAESQARAEAEAKLRALASRPVETAACECCGRANIPKASLKRIDSGQPLCPDCLAALRAEVERIRGQASSRPRSALSAGT